MTQTPIEVEVRGVKARIEPCHDDEGFWIVGKGGWGLNIRGNWRTERSSGFPATFPSPADAQAFVDRLNAEPATPSPQAAESETQEPLPEGYHQCSNCGTITSKSHGHALCNPASDEEKARHRKWFVTNWKQMVGPVVEQPPAAGVKREHCPHCENQRGFLPCPYCHWNGNEPPQPPAAPAAGVRERLTWRCAVMDNALASLSASADGILKHFKEDGTIAGTGEWRGRELFKRAKEIDRVFGECVKKLSTITDGGNPETICNGCGKQLEKANAWMDDGCPCNTPAGVNNGNQLISNWRRELWQEQQGRVANLTRQLAARDAEIERLKIKADSFDALWQVCIECGMEVHPPGIDEDGEYIPEEHAYQFAFIRGLRESLTSAQSALAAEREGREKAEQALDDNWVSHQRLVAAERELATVRQQLAEARQVVHGPQTLTPGRWKISENQWREIVVEKEQPIDKGYVAVRVDGKGGGA